MNHEKKLAELSKQIEFEKRKLSELRRKLRERKKAEFNKNKKPMPRGRPTVSEDTLVKAVKLLETKTFADVCLRLNISVTTLYRYGITRQVLEGKKPYKPKI